VAKTVFIVRRQMSQSANQFFQQKEEQEKT
jgi:hypothetical protein